ncbi:TetR/AcrR family transcriptional regulator [Paraburkholderia sp.]|uniref:TetR/AcrR family transcriptional regulator n=1 Tax=Paraburkholderia sp. TaxID=1926495 RepID=UPI002387AB89|nr:TetR/AcrR family transcriptional regulator [Paraburkholderia sp.]MDE1182520.1 TetR/AcrR family transcriptional regulator [Paraburkholderia sp.]
MKKKPPAEGLEPRKAPAQRRSAATVDAIVEAAARILEADGLAGYTTNAIAARAGVSIGSLYQYFPNRDALTAALIERETGALLAQADLAAQSIRCADALALLIDAAVAHQMRRPDLARILDFEERRLPVGEHNRRVGEVLQEAVVTVLALPDGPAIVDRQTAAFDVLALVRGILDMAGERRETDAAALRARVAIAVDGYLNGVATAGL